jgi:hypothetical protein
MQWIIYDTTPRINDTGSRRLPVSLIRGVGDPFFKLKHNLRLYQAYPSLPATFPIIQHISNTSFIIPD